VAVVVVHLQLLLLVVMVQLVVMVGEGLMRRRVGRTVRRMKGGGRLLALEGVKRARGLQMLGGVDKQAMMLLLLLLLLLLVAYLRRDGAKVLLLMMVGRGVEL
jgi:hypothetical protein